MHIRTLILVLVAVLGCIGIIIGSGVLDLGKKEQPVVEAPVVTSFEECAAAGYPIMESYPARCATPDGRTYVQEIPAPEPTYLNASSDLIVIDTPAPGSVTGKQFEVRGQARGTWFFEASFPIEIRDAQGTIIARGIGQPVGGADWMTEGFVPFASTIEVPESFIGDALVTLMNDNPSGLPENARSVSFPITIEY